MDDTIASHTKPSSQALHPIEAAYFHQSHLKGRQDYGHQIASVMLSCNGITLNYAVVLYNKTKSKIQIIQDIAAELPIAPVVSYFPCDSWYTSAKVMDCFAQKGFHTIGALKTNRILYPCGIRQKASAFALHMCCTCKGTYCSFDEGYAYMQQQLKAEHLKNLFQVIKNGATFEEVLEIAG